MKNSLVLALAAACGVVGSAHAQGAQSYSYDLNWSGAGFYDWYKDNYEEVSLSGRLPITVTGDDTTLSESIGGYSFTITTTANPADPAHPDAVISGTIEGGQLDPYGATLSFYADSQSPFAGSVSAISGSLAGFVGGASLTFASAVPEPANLALLVAALPLVGWRLRKRQRSA